MSHRTEQGNEHPRYGETYYGDAPYGAAPVSQSVDPAQPSYGHALQGQPVAQQQYVETASPCGSVHQQIEPQQQWPQQPHQPHQPHPPKKKSLWGLWLALGLVVLLGLGVAGVGYAVNRVVALPGELFKSATGESLEEIQKHGHIYEGTIKMSDRPGFQEMVSHIEATKTKYLNMGESELYAIFPGGKAGFDPGYYRDFLYILTDLRNATRFMAEDRGTDPGDFDDQIAGMRTETDEYERMFLAQEDFDTTFEIEQSDGTVYKSDGKYNSSGTINDAEKKRTGGYTRAQDPDAFAASFQPYLDANGRYVDAAAELAGNFGIGINYKFSDVEQYCTRSGSVTQDQSNVGAVFCPASPEWIYINDQGKRYPEILSQPFYLDMVKHELSHGRIFEACGTTAPTGAADAGVHYEGVTNSYAVQFMGASRDLLAKSASNYPEYQMNETTDRIAQQIKNGQCG